MEGRKIRKTMAITTLALLVMAIGGVSALWLANMNFTGNVVVTSGEAPASVEYTMDIAIADNNNQTINYDYDNTDGDATFRFVLNTTAIYSNETLCDYQEDEDLKFFVVKDGTWYHMSESVQPDILFTAGANNYDVIITPHPNRCELLGSVSLSAGLV